MGIFNKKQFYSAVIIAMSLGALVIACKPRSKTGLKTPAPDFALNDIQGKSVALKDFRGKVVMINFWATWCAPCRREMPSLELLSQKMKGKDFVILGVNLDEEGKSSVESFLKIIPATFPILLDQDQRVSNLYQTFQIPETFLINQEGIIEDQFSGPQDFNEDVFTAKIERLINSK